MKVTVVGAGYVGLVTGACLAELGNHVVCLDSDAGRVAVLRAGGVPIHEPGLHELIARNGEGQRLRFTADAAEAFAHGEVVFIAVGTPPREDGSADLQHVLAVARELGRHMEGFKVVVNKSTVPVGTADKVREAIATELAARGCGALPFAMVSNPEFLKEGSAIEDFMRPDRLVVGLDDGAHAPRAREAMEQLYATFNRHHQRTLWMDLRSAELTKYAANAMLATRISFMNEIANLADMLGADVDAVRRGIGADTRIGHSFLYAGTGYGGSCFPKDTRALVQTALDHGCLMRVVAATERVNAEQKTVLVQRVLAHFGDDLTGCRFALWGLAFKPNTDDMREAPSRVIARALLERGACLSVYDPVAMDEARRAFAHDLQDLPGAFDRVHFAGSAPDATLNADALLVVTEWKNFHHPDFDALRARMARPLILDGRNLYDPALLQRHGFAYHGVGRRNARALAAFGAPAPARATPEAAPAR